MKHKATSTFTAEEKEMMDTIAVNYVIAQSDGFQLGYAQALSDFTEYIMDYWQGSDDKPQQSILDVLVDLGVELGKRKQLAKRNADTAIERGYESYYHWQYKHTDTGAPFTISLNLYTKAEESEEDNHEHIE